MTNKVAFARSAKNYINTREPLSQRLLATLGVSDSGPVETGRDKYVFCRIGETEVAYVYNQRVPNTPGLKVWIGFSKDRPDLYQVLDVADTFDTPLSNPAGPHSNTHTWPERDTVWVRGEQYLPGLVAPYSGQAVTVYSQPVWGDSGWRIPQLEYVNLQQYNPTSGSVWALIEHNVSGSIAVRTSQWVETKEMLEPWMIPAPSGTTCAAVALYGQPTITATKRKSDIVDLRSNSPRGGTGGGGGTAAVWGNIVGSLSDQTDLQTALDAKLSIVATNRTVLGTDASHPADAYSSYQVKANNADVAATFVVAGSDLDVAGSVFGAHGNGTLASPTATKNNARLVSLAGSGHDGSNWIGSRAAIRLAAAEDWSGSAQGSRIEFWETATGTATMTLRSTLSDLINVTGLGAAIHAAASKATPVDADELGLWDSVANAIKSLTWANLKATLKTYFDTIYLALADRPSTETQTADIYSANPGGVSEFVGTIATLPGGANLTYNVTSGNEGALTSNGGNIGKLVLHNTTKGTNALISSCNTGTNTITLTANVPAGWATTDVITIQSQTVASTGYVDIDISGGSITRTNLLCGFFILSTASSHILRYHPYETFSAAKSFPTLTQAASTLIGTLWPVKITSGRFSILWTGSPSVIVVREAGYL